MGNCSPNPHPVPYHALSQYFDVYNVDARLLKHSKGRIQITANSMFLFQKDLDPVIWPLNAIRRYGSHKDIFLFESGRRCSTGEGMFAFKCKQSKFIEECIKNLISKKTTTHVNNDNNTSRNSLPRSVITNHQDSDQDQIASTGNYRSPDLNSNSSKMSSKIFFFKQISFLFKLK